MFFSPDSYFRSFAVHIVFIGFQVEGENDKHRAPIDKSDGAQVNDDHACRQRREEKETPA